MEQDADINIRDIVDAAETYKLEDIGGWEDPEGQEQQECRHNKPIILCQLTITKNIPTLKTDKIQPKITIITTTNIEISIK